MTSTGSPSRTARSSNRFSSNAPSLPELRASVARDSLLRFATETNPFFQVGAHHRAIADLLHAVERGETKRAMIFMPPRHGKSELASHLFPAWCLGRGPRRQIIAAAYNSEKAKDYGEAVREIIRSDEYRRIFPDVRLKTDSRAAHRMRTRQGGVYYAGGVATAMTGRGADFAIIDDPVKDREQGESGRMRNKAWSWYQSTLRTRLMPGGAIVLIQTRWHEDDLAGRLLAKQGRKEEGGKWTVLEMPAISAAGQALWPERYSLAELEETREEVGPREWSALYQQQPQPEGGTYFKREHFQEWEAKPERLHVYGTSDYATKQDGGDFTVHQVWGVDVDGNLYRLAQWKGQVDTNELIHRKLDLIARWRPHAWFGEAGQIQNAIEPFLNRAMNERRIWCGMNWLPSIHDKETRAWGFQGMVSAGKVFFEPGADVGEYLAFPNGKYDDEVDASSLIGRALNMAHKALIGLDGKPVPKKDRWEKLWDEDRDDMAQWEKDEWADRGIR